MARMYSGKRGRAGSSKPDSSIAKPWISYSADEVEQLIVKLAKTGIKSALIGVILRDKYGIPSVKEITKKTISKILKDHKAYSELPEDFLTPS